MHNESAPNKELVVSEHSFSHSMVFSVSWNAENVQLHHQIFNYEVKKFLSSFEMRTSFLVVD